MSKKSAIVSRSRDMQMASDWSARLQTEINSDYFQGIIKQLSEELSAGHSIYPDIADIFAAFDRTSFDDTKVVLLGQDPYHKSGQAMGLSFSVPRDQKIPPSLRNIYKELQTDLGIEPPSHGDLSDWADEGVLLLNTILTVEESQPGSHRALGWERFTDAVISILSAQKSNLVFLLWGNFAQSKKPLIDESKHLVLSAAHPSPLARGAFFGSRPFSQTNAYLKSMKISPINWNIKA